MPEGARSTEEQALLLLVNGMGDAEVERFCRSRGQSGGEAAATVAEARRRITLAADFRRDEQLGKAVMRMEDVYRRAIRGKDPRTALQAQRELCRLLALYDREGAGAGEADEADGDHAARLALIERYLIPLGLADPTYPVEEHARIAAERLRAGATEPKG